MRRLAAPLYGLLLWGMASWLAWLMLAALDFLYPLAYRALDIGATLQTYVPQNRFGKQDYPFADIAQHFAHFSAIAQAIHAHGAGLAQLTYQDGQGRALGLLLTPDEVLHLQDVARLVDAGMLFGALMSLGWLACLAIMLHSGWALPRLRNIMLATAVILLVLAALLAVLGFKPVFYALHVWIFPANHPWFFYYQDSLMSTLMQAPNLFALIGVAWLLSAVLILLLLDFAARFLARRMRLVNHISKGESA
ncbi:MAG: DUF1461 domain-containing protein [Pseudomonadota bacterium]